MKRTKYNSVNSTKIIFLPILLVLAMIFSVSAVYAYTVLFHSDVVGQIGVNTFDFTNDSNISFDFSYDTNTTPITFNAAGEKKTGNLKVTNGTDSLLHYKYEITSTADSNVSKSIFVYYNDDYLGTLDNVSEIETNYNYIKNKNSTGNFSSDTLTLELHNGADTSIINSASFDLTIIVYTLTVDYENNMYVSTENEFKSAINDINSGALSNPCIVLLNNLTLTNSYEINNPCTFNLTKYALSGNLTLNDDDAVIDVIAKKDEGMNANVTLTKYNHDLAIELIKTKLDNFEINANTSKKLLGNLSFYNQILNITAKGSNYSYTKSTDIIQTNDILATAEEEIKVDDTTIAFKIIGSKDNAYNSLVNNYLKHLPLLNGEIITKDLFLPSSISSLNATINWTSSNENAMDNNGVINSNLKETTQVTLYADISINNQAYRKTYTFSVAVSNNETRFADFIAVVSPITLYNVYDGSNAAKALYYLPSVSKNHLITM